MKPQISGELDRSSGPPVSIAGSLAGVLGTATNATEASEETTRAPEPIERAMDARETRTANPAEEPSRPSQRDPLERVEAPEVRSDSTPEIAMPASDNARPIEDLRPISHNETTPKRDHVKPEPTKKTAQHPRTRDRRQSRASKAGTDRQGAAGAHRGGTGGNQAASAGSIRSYAASVRARILAHRPGSVGLGRVVVAFGLTASGGLRYARIARSGGSSSVDRAALGAVMRSSPFPRPPAGSSAGQLQFSISFTFQ
jgi:protein TonB